MNKSAFLGLSLVFLGLSPLLAQNKKLEKQLEQIWVLDAQRTKATQIQALSQYQKQLQTELDAQADDQKKIQLEEAKFIYAMIASPGYEYFLDYYQFKPKKQLVVKEKRNTAEESTWSLSADAKVLSVDVRGQMLKYNIISISKDSLVLQDVSAKIPAPQFLYRSSLGTQALPKNAAKVLANTWVAVPLEEQTEMQKQLQAVEQELNQTTDEEEKDQLRTKQENIKTIVGNLSKAKIELLPNGQAKLHQDGRVLDVKWQYEPILGHLQWLNQGQVVESIPIVKLSKTELRIKADFVIIILKSL